jgi:hypothetical protein
MIDIVTVFMNALYATLSTVVLKKLKATLTLTKLYDIHNVNG